MVTSQKTGRKEILHINILQIIGPILVILGHTMNGSNAVMGLTASELAGFEKYWYIFSKHWIYIFHLPLFFMISGYLLAYGNFLNGKKYSTFISKKFWRLLFPYLVWNLICYVPKLYFQELTSDVVSSTIGGVIKAFLFPRDNIWGHTWFLVAIFIMYLFTPIWEKVLKNKAGKIILGVAAVILFLFPIETRFLCIRDLCKNLIYFMLGCLLGQLPIETFREYAKKYVVGLTTAAIILSLIFAPLYDQLYRFMIIPGSVILLALICLGANKTNLSPKMIELSKRSFGIYIMHWPVMIATRTVLLKLGVPFIGIIPVVAIAGFVVPNVIIWFINKVKLNKFAVVKSLLGV